LNGVLPQRRFGVVGIRQGREVGDDNIDSMYDIGCSAQVEQVHQLPEGRYDLAASGEQRFRLLSIDTERAPYLMATVEWLPDTEPGEGSPRQLAASARAAHERYHGTGLRGDSYDPPEPDTPLSELSYALA